MLQQPQQCSIHIITVSVIKHLAQAGIKLCDVGLSRSEGGFKENKVSSASVLDVQAANDKKGKPYYKYEILTRTGIDSQDMLRYASLLAREACHANPPP